MDWITTEVSDADYTIKATAIDSAGLTSSDSISVTVSNTTPSLSISLGFSDEQKVSRGTVLLQQMNFVNKK